MTIHETLRSQILADCFDGQAPADFDDHYDLIENGHMDSLRLMGLVTLSEQRFGIQFGINDMVPKHFRNINAVAGYVQQGIGDEVARP
jgi:acyl carrier protein